MFEMFKKLKWVLAIIAVLLCFIALNLVLNLAEGSIGLWERLQDAPLMVTVPYLVLSVLLVAFTFWLVWKLVKPEAKPKEEQAPYLVDAESVAQKYKEAEAKGIDVDEAFSELERWRSERGRGEIRIATLGNISVGKTSLIKAMLPDAELVDHEDDLNVDVLGGSTRQNKQFVWTSSAGDQLILEDVPGLQEVKDDSGKNLDAKAIEAVQRAHVCLFVTEGDITQTEHQALNKMLSLQKPTIIVLNKADRFNQEEIALIKEKLSSYVKEIATELNLKLDVPIVTAISGGEEEVEIHQADGSIVLQTRPRKTDTLKLKQALQNLIDKNAKWLQSLRDSAVFVLVDQKLNEAETQHKKQHANKVTKKYTKRAIVGAMAAVAPGSDLLIQGYLGKQMVNELCEVYEIEAKGIDIQSFLELVEQHMRKALPVVLAIAGNGMKAFPGIGTVTGGIAHAGAYGLIFDAMGRSLSETLAKRGTLSPHPAATQFQDYLNENLAIGTRKFAQLVLEARQENSSRELIDVSSKDATKR